ncbi:MAG: TonB-dependent receptor domain-containing protein [Symbiopectobacterium sp.]|uniref:TonB-dependent receptor domain-containing protein n=1 Tax=Symbiopectobacterium sp. TaxID=2952789 RepID=UPI003F3A82E1
MTSKSVELELNEALTDNWQMTFGAARYVAKDAADNRVNSQLPQTTLKWFTRYQLPMLPELTLGGGVNWQNGTFVDISGPNGAARVHQGSYPLVNLFGRYQINKQRAVQANVNNLLDKSYYSALSGVPRSVSMSVNYNF